MSISVYHTDSRMFRQVSVKSEVKLSLICQHRNSGTYSGKKEGRMCSLKFWGVHHALLQQLEDKESSPTGLGINFWNHLT